VLDDQDSILDRVGNLFGTAYIPAVGHITLRMKWVPMALRDKTTEESNCVLNLRYEYVGLLLI
jgi:hypothetical protein